MPWREVVCFLEQKDPKSATLKRVACPSEELSRPPGPALTARSRQGAVELGVGHPFLACDDPAREFSHGRSEYGSPRSVIGPADYFQLMERVHPRRHF